MEMQLSLKGRMEFVTKKMCSVFKKQNKTQRSVLRVSSPLETGTPFVLLHRMDCNNGDWDIIKSCTWHVWND